MVDVASDNHNSFLSPHWSPQLFSRPHSRIHHTCHETIGGQSACDATGSSFYTFSNCWQQIFTVFSFTCWPHNRVRLSMLSWSNLSCPWHHNRRHSQLLENDRLLLVVADCHDGLLVFLDKLTEMDGAIRRQKYTKFLHRDRIGQEFIAAYEESKRMLIFCASTKVVSLVALRFHNLMKHFSFWCISSFSMKILDLCVPWAVPCL